MLLTVLFACALRGAPPVYAEPVPPPEPPAAAVFDAAADECPVARPLIPGEPPPFVRDGLAICRAQVVPESQAFDLVQAADLADFWQDRARLCEGFRAADRARGQAAADMCWQENGALRREAAAHRVAAGALFVGGVVVGLAAGATYQAWGSP